MNRVLLIVALASLSGCAAQTFTINGERGEVPTQQRSQDFFVSGLGQERVTNAAEVCGGANNVIKVESQQTFLNGALAILSFGIYTPRDAKVYCRTSAERQPVAASD